MDSFKFQKVAIIVDNSTSWFWEYVAQLGDKIKPYAKELAVYRHIDEIETGDILFILSCDRIFKKNILEKFENNIVVHASDLPQGKGWSPISWQVEAGSNTIPITLFEAEEGLDSGDWYIKDIIRLDGNELVDEIRAKLFKTLEKMILEFIENYPVTGHRQSGQESFFDKRSAQNQELDIDRTIRDQFNKLRVCDNQRYPAHFTINNQKYIIKINKA